MRSIAAAILAFVALQASSSRAIQLDRAAIFLEFCTGTRIAEKIVLTAYHCVQNRLPRWASGGGAKIKIIDYLASPLARETRFDVAHDMALLYLEKSLPADVPILPLASRGQRFDKYVRLGYGFHAGRDGWIHDEALGILKNDEVVFWGKHSGERGKLKFAQPANRTCPGDSGGPTLGFNNGEWYVVGVTSRVMPDMRHRFSWIIPLIRGKALPDYARYCGEYYTSERATENLEFLAAGVQTLVARHEQTESSPVQKRSSKRDR